MAKLKQMREVFEQALKTLTWARPDCPIYGRARWVANLPFWQIRVCDEICRGFAETLDVRATDPELLAQLRLRLEMAYGICDGHADETVPGDMTGSEAIEHLLVDVWHRRGIEWTRNTYGGDLPCGPAASDI